MPEHRADRAGSITWHLSLNDRRDGDPLSVTFTGIRWTRGNPVLVHRETVSVPDPGFDHRDSNALRSFFNAISEFAGH